MGEGREEAGLRLKTAKFMLEAQDWGSWRCLAAPGLWTQREARQIPTTVTVLFPVPSLSLSPGVDSGVHQGNICDQDDAFHPPHFPLAGTVLPHFIDRRPMLLNLPPTLLDSCFPPWGIPGKGSSRNFWAKMLTECRQAPTPLKKTTL